MTCRTLDAWLDAGQPRRGDAAARAHAASCASCGIRLRAAEKVEALLAAGLGGGAYSPLAAPLAEQVMARVRAEEHRRRALAAGQGIDPFPFWVRAASEPAAALALVLGALAVWQAPALAPLAARAASWLERLPVSGWAALAPTLPPAPALDRLEAEPLALLGLALAVLSASLASAAALARWCERAIARA